MAKALERNHPTLLSPEKTASKLTKRRYAIGK
jgi:hypothetical protein